MVVKKRCPFCGQTALMHKESFSCFFCGKTGTKSDFYALQKGTGQAILAPDNVENALRKAEKIFSEKLWSGHAYLKRRELTPDKIETFGLGWSDGNLKQKVSRKEAEILKNLGIIRPDDTDIFKNRLVFPIVNEHGQTVGFGGRTIYDGVKPKYINSPESDVFKKKHILYGIQNISDKPVYLLEGYFDVITAQAEGVNAVACLGTAFGLGHIEILLSKGVEELIIALDSDEAGRKNAVKAALLARNYFKKVSVLPSLNGAKDADEFIIKQGGEAYLNLPTIPVEYFLIQQGLNPADVL